MPDGAADYRPMSVAAVTAAALGAASAIAVVSPVFWVLPLIAIAMAVVGLRDVARPELPKAGRLAAIAGLALAVGFGTQAVVSTATGRLLAASRAEAAARVWLAAIQDGRVGDARGMCQSEVAGAVESLAACVGGPAVVRRSWADEPKDAWVVEAAIGDCEAVVRLAPTRTIRQGRPADRWMINSVDLVRSREN
jgi:hypothetical protein